MLKLHPGEKRYARRNAEGRSTQNQVDVGRSLAADRKSKEQQVVAQGQGPGRPETCT
jgi:hypothetical protein